MGLLIGITLFRTAVHESLSKIVGAYGNPLKYF